MDFGEERVYFLWLTGKWEHTEVALILTEKTGNAVNI